MDLRKLKTLIDLVSESNVSELEITEAEGKVRIVKSSGAPVVMAAPLAAAPAMVAPTAALAAVPAAPMAGARRRNEERPKHGTHRCRNHHESCTRSGSCR